MIIVTCAVPGALHPATEEAITEHWTAWGNPWNFHVIDPTDPHQYGDILATYWEQGADFAIVEPDIVIREDVAEAFLNCEHDYCCFPYAWLTDVGPALGCTRFRSTLIKQYPRLLSDVQQTRVTWNQLDVVLMRHFLARDHGHQPHVHQPAVEHLNPRKQLLEGRPREPLTQVPHW